MCEAIALPSAAGIEATDTGVRGHRSTSYTTADCEAPKLAVVKWNEFSNEVLKATLLKKEIFIYTSLLVLSLI